MTFVCELRIANRVLLATCWRIFPIADAAIGHLQLQKIMNRDMIQKKIRSDPRTNSTLFGLARRGNPEEVGV